MVAGTPKTKDIFPTGILLLCPVVHCVGRTQESTGDCDGNLPERIALPFFHSGKYLLIGTVTDGPFFSFFCFLSNLKRPLVFTCN